MLRWPTGPLLLRASTEYRGAVRSASRSPDGGPPLAAKRSGASLPQDVDLSAADSMIAGRGVQPGQSVSVIARISASGSLPPLRGDLYGQIGYVARKSGPRALEIDRLSP
jgi:hypothetical protein